MADDESAWRQWKEATFGSEYMIWHDGLYTGSVAGLRGAARDEALAMLRLGLRLGDSHAAEALAAMGDTDTVAAMCEQLARAHGTERVRIALALHELAPDRRLAEHLVDVLATAGDWSTRIDAAMGLLEDLRSRAQGDSGA